MEEVVQEVVTPEIVEAPITEQAVTQENAEPSKEIAETKPERTFTQKELDEIITKRLERDRESTSKKAAQEARDALIAEENIVYNGKQIKTESEYKAMQKEREIRKQYEGKVDDDLLDEIVESKKFREEYQQEKLTQAQKDKQNAEFIAFFEAYPTIDVKKDIPVAVWQEVDKGKSLLDAYVKHENKSLREQLAQVTAAKQIEQQNEANAASSTGSVTGNGSVLPAHFTQEQVSQMSTAEVNKHWTAINESMKKW